MSAVVLALAGALVYGVADFLGGLATTRARALLVAVASQAVGLVVVLPAVLVLGGVVSASALGWGAAAGAAGSLGVACYYRALAIGPMGLVSPLAAVVGALVPLVVGLWRGERPGTLALVGVGVAVVAVAVASAGHGRVRRLADLAGAGPLLGLLAGLGFGLFFVLVAASPDDSGLWPLVAARGFVVLVLLPVVLGATAVRGTTRAWLAGVPWGLVVLTGLLDQAANVLFLLAARAGLLSVSGVLVSLYPVVVVVLAAVVLRERLRPLQQAAALAALVGALLMALDG